MATRTIESPGVEWNEYDLSQVISYATGTNVVVMGFAHQGPTNQVVEITSKEELMLVFFGNIGPQNAAERYFYHSCIEILNTKGKLLCIRLPYGSGKGSGFSTGYVATAFYGQNVEMTSAAVCDWLIKSGTGITSAYVEKLFREAGDGNPTQTVTKINPKPESFVISEELYQELMDGALEDAEYDASGKLIKRAGLWHTPEYDPLKNYYVGAAYKYTKDTMEEGSPILYHVVSGEEAYRSFYGQDALNLATVGTSAVEYEKVTSANIGKMFLSGNSATNSKSYFLVYDSEATSATEHDDATMLDALIYGENEDKTIVGYFTSAEGEDSIVFTRRESVPYYADAFDVDKEASAKKTTVLDALRKSVFFTINRTESSVTEDYEGFYMTVCDQDPFVRRGRTVFAAEGLDIITDINALSMDNVDFSESATSAWTAGSEFVACKVLDEIGGTGMQFSGSMWDCVEYCKDNGLPKETWVEYCIDPETNDKVIVKGDPTKTVADSVRCQTLNVPSRKLMFNKTGINSFSQSLVDSLPYVFDKTDFANAMHIGVHRMFQSIENDKLTYATLETFTGAINPEAQIGTKNGGRENYGIERMADNHSGYITLRLNPFYEDANNVPLLVRFGGKVQSEGPIRTIDDKANTEGVCVSLGGYRSCADENGNEFIGNLPAKIDNALLLIDSPLERDIDILIDGGLSTIWGYTYGVGEVMEKVAEDATEFLDYQNFGYDAKEFDENRYIGKAFKKLLRKLGTDEFFNDRAACAIKDSIYSIFTQFNVFCSKTRKDCIFISDPPRFFFVHGEDTKASSKKDWIFSLDMYHPLKNLYEAANTSYSCTYMNWVKKYDNTLADFVWLPMSPFAAAIMCEVDAKYFMWWAPFGLNNGVLETITDIAFRPNQGQCDYFYKTGFNPVCYFNDGGFVIWGQKTLLDKHSAFDRLNVRRLFLYLERKTVKALRWFIGEPNTTYTRARVIDTIKPLYDYCMANSGLYDYLLKCDEENNPPDIIDDNTLVVDIYLKPVRTIEFILANFYACRTGADFSEIVG